MVKNKGEGISLTPPDAMTQRLSLAVAQTVSPQRCALVVPSDVTVLASDSWRRARSSSTRLGLCMTIARRRIRWRCLPFFQERIFQDLSGAPPNISIRLTMGQRVFATIRCHR